MPESLRHKWAILHDGNKCQQGMAHAPFSLLPPLTFQGKETPKLICIVIQLSEELKQQLDILKQRGFVGFIVCHKVGA